MAERTLVNRVRLGRGSARRLKDGVGGCQHRLSLFSLPRDLKTLIIELVYEATFSPAVISCH